MAEKRFLADVAIMDHMLQLQRKEKGEKKGKPTSRKVYWRGERRRRRRQRRGCGVYVYHFWSVLFFPWGIFVFFHSRVRHKSTREENAEFISRQKMKARTVVVVRGEKGPLLCDPGSELLLGERALVVRG